jgi:hypothetical protein
MQRQARNERALPWYQFHRAVFILSNQSTALNVLVRPIASFSVWPHAWDVIV